MNGFGTHLICDEICDSEIWNDTFIFTKWILNKPFIKFLFLLQISTYSSTLVVFHSWELCLNELSIGDSMCKMVKLRAVCLKCILFLFWACPKALVGCLVFLPLPWGSLETPRWFLGPQERLSVGRRKPLSMWNQPQHLLTLPAPW